MRLINKTTYSLEWFVDEEHAPPFVILSHRWNGRETSLQEYTQECQQPSDSHSAGTAKIIAFCEYISDRSEQYAWVDTCCIDKTSSSELQEAIASMYKWYEESALCVVFLDDVEKPSNTSQLCRDFAQSRWWTRGWTLQELLAPKHQIFVDRDWTPIGSRSDLADKIVDITGIPAHCIGDSIAIRKIPVGRRMSWLSHRQTTRIEDLAYCMLGIFDVSMTMLYGEGRNAFWRLQKEILQVTDDETIFLWTTSKADDLVRSTILAPVPLCFAGLRTLDYQLNTYFPRDPCRMTARGLELELYATRSSILDDEVKVPLNCLQTSNNQRPYLQLQRRSDPDHALSTWRRVEHIEIRTLDEAQYYQPDSEQKEYLEQYRAIETDAVQQMSSAHNKVNHSNPYQAVWNFEQELIRRKIFVS